MVRLLIENVKVPAMLPADPGMNGCSGGVAQHPPMRVPPLLRHGHELLGIAGASVHRPIGG